MSDPYRVTMDGLIAGNVLSNSIKEIARLELAADEIDSSDAREGLLAKAAIHRQFAESVNQINLVQGGSGSVNDLVALAKEDLIDRGLRKRFDEEIPVNLATTESPLDEDHQCDSFLCDQRSEPEDTASEGTTSSDEEPQFVDVNLLMDAINHMAMVVIIPKYKKEI